ncbi:MAG TPA: hypothetical protein VGL62_00155, partial [Vicinamibacterales bacterium]
MAREARREAGGGRRRVGRGERSIFDRPVWVAVALAVLTIAVYAPVRHFQLVNWDDQLYVTENPMVLGGLSWHSAWWALTTTHSPYWHPLTWFSLLLDVTMFGRDAGAYHVTSVVLHACSAMLLYVVFRRMTNAPGPSAFVAAIFAVHPLHVESVAWIAERKDVLSTLFWTVTLWAYVRYAAAPGRARYLTVVGAYALALMSKPMVMTLPVMLLLLDWWPLRRAAAAPGDKAERERARGFAPASTARLIGEKLPLLAMALPVAIATMIVQRRVGAVAGLEALPLGTRITNATVSYVVYIGKTIWPSGLAPFYPFHAYPPWLVLIAVACLLAATAGAFVVRARWPHVFVGWFWYVIALAPVIGLTQAGEQARADRFMYVPMTGLLVILAWTVDGWLAHQGARQDRAARTAAAPGRGRSATVVVAIVAIAACGVTARAQVETWSDSVTLWQHALALNPDNYVAYGKLGEAYRDRGEFDRSLLNYRKELTLAPPNSPHLMALLHNDIGIVLTRADRPLDAS